jgi:2-hydroxymuconate-semialdehyde hydrolase
MSAQEREFDFEGIRVRYLEGGRGFPILMIHGSGPGASTLGNWRLVLEPLAERFHIFAMDLVGFGRSERKPRPPYFDLELWLRQCRAMLARIAGERVGVIGHSLSGTLALKLAALESRIAAVLTTGTMGARFTPNEQTVRTWTFPRDRAELRRTAEGLVYDRALIDDAYLDNREKVLFTGDYAEYFGAMFAGDKQRFIDAAVIAPEELARVRCPVTMMHGRDDVGFPPELTLRVAQALPQADVILIGRCSHSIAMEHPAKLVAQAELLFR